MRLITFGCSYTYGSGLADCFVPPMGHGPVPSKLAWPQLVANELNMDCVNMSSPGASNKEILNTLLNFKFDSSDVVIVMWSFVERWCKIKNYTSIDRLTHNLMKSNPNVLSQYDKVFTFEDMQFDFIYRANFAKMYLDKLNLKNYHLSVNPEECCLKVMPVWTVVDFIGINLSLMRIWTHRALDIANNGGHPGPEAHQMVAIGLIEELSNAHNK
jgi:hypothetical protein